MNKKLLTLIISGVISGNAFADKITNFNVDLNENKTILNFNFDNDILKTPNVIYQQEFREIIIPFEGVYNSNINKEYNINENGIEKIIFKEDKNITYATIKLIENSPFTISKNKNSFKLKLKKVSKVENGITEIVSYNNNNLLEDIKFSIEDESPKIVINANRENINFEKLKEENFIEYRFKNTKLPSKLFRNLNVEDFKTPIKSILSKMDNEDSIIRIEMYKNKEVNIKETKLGNNLIILFEDVSNKIILTKNTQDSIIDEKEYTGELINFDYQDIPVSAALKLIASEMGVNLVVSDSVKGTITMQLNKVPYDQALDIILQTKGLEKRLNGNILYIAPLEEIIKREEIELQSKMKIKEIEPLNTETVQIKYAKAKDITKILESLISKRGRIIFDERTNKVMLEDTNKKITEVKSMIETLDIPVRQVVIESRIVFAKDNLQKELGVKWSGGYQHNTGSSLTMIGGNQGGLSSISSNSGNLAGSINPPNSSLVNLGVGNPTSSIAFGFLNDSLSLDLELSALEKNGDIEIVSKPKIITADKKEAEIKSGTEYPYTEVTESGAGAVAFKDIDLALKVTPHITPNDKVILDLNITQDSIAELTAAGPSVDSTEIKTQILANNGETIVLGGIYKSEKIYEVEKTPVLGDLPVLGNLFKKKVKSDDKVELLIFITPKLVDSKKYE